MVAVDAYGIMRQCLEGSRDGSGSSSGVVAGSLTLRNTLDLFKSVFGLPGDIEDREKWEQLLSWGAGSLMGEALWTVASWIACIVLFLYASSGWWSRFVPFLRSDDDPSEDEPSDEEIEQFRKLNLWAVDCQSTLDM